MQRFTAEGTELAEEFFRAEGANNRLSALSADSAVIPLQLAGTDYVASHRREPGAVETA